MARNSNPSSNPMEQFFSADFAKGFASMQGLPFDVNAVMETQRRNMQAFSDAQQMAIEGIKAVAARQSQILSQILEENSQIAREAMAEGSPEDKISKQADRLKKVYEKGVAGAREISDMMGKSNQAAQDVINKRVSASLTEIKSAVEKKKTKAA
ncbi:MAG: TIGR01841 family phasin [Rhodospirillales bacterium]|nr:TIGR01841 family phasin [Rhodospirillales bacterium]